MSITVKMNGQDLLEMLVNRCNAWDISSNNKDLFEKMYEEYIYNGCFEGAEIDVMQIVDNDAINYCNVLYEDDENFNKVLELYKQGERDISCEDLGWSFIEAVSDNEDRILVRY